MTLEDKMNEYRKRVDGIQQTANKEKEFYLQKIFALFDKMGDLDYNRSKSEHLRNLKAFVSSPAASDPKFMQVELTSSNDLNRIDTEFTNIFNRDNLFPRSYFSYPIIYCETLEEFFTYCFQDEALSASQKAENVKAMVNDAKNSSSQIFGVNIPGVGCYLNGWVFGHKFGMDPLAALKHPGIFSEIAQTAIHEKLGHGFLKLASQLGATMNNLGCRNVENAGKFYQSSFTDAADTRRLEQYKVLFLSCAFVEEGWATWIASYLTNRMIGKKHPEYRIEDWNTAVNQKGIKRLIPTIEQEIRRHSAVLLKPEDKETGGSADRTSRQRINIPAIHESMSFFSDHQHEIPSYLKGSFRQPIRYVLGSLLARQIEVNCGPLCVPHAAVIAGNIKFDLEKIGLSDLAKITVTNPLANANTRFALISQLEIPKKNDIRAFARSIEEELSIPVPEMYKHF